MAFLMCRMADWIALGAPCWSTRPPFGNRLSSVSLHCCQISPWTDGRAIIIGITVFRNEIQLTKHTTETHVKKQSVIESSPNFTGDQDKLFQCEKCNFKSTSENGLKIHTTKKHTQSTVQNRGQFSPRCPPRLPPRFPPISPGGYTYRYPMSPYDV